MRQVICDMISKIISNVEKFGTKFPVYISNILRMQYYHTSESHSHTTENVLKHSITATSIEDAEDIFVYAKNSLLSVNNWKQYNPAINTSFELTNNNGYMLHRHAHTGDNIRISAPGADTSWIHIDSIVYDDYPDTCSESITVYLVPCDRSLNLITGEQVQADLDSLNHEAIFSFAIERSGLQVHAIYTGGEDLTILPVAQLHTLVGGFIDFEEK